MRVYSLSFAALIAVAACGGRQNVQCEQDSDCDLSGGGLCIAAPTGNEWCGYPDPDCASGYRFSDLDVGDGVSGQFVAETAADAGVDGAMTDAPGARAFDIAYPSEWKFSVAGPIGQYFLIINTSTTPLNTVAKHA